MAISAEMVAAMRTYLSALQTNSDAARDETDRQFLPLLKTDRIEGLSELLLAAFTIAARRRFSPTWSPAEIVRFAADVRSRNDEMAAMLGPSVAENQLRLALGEKLTPYPDMEARGWAQMLLLGVLTSGYTRMSWMRCYPTPARWPMRPLLPLGQLDRPSPDVARRGEAQGLA